jgi:PAS domain S-box-containing protein
MSTALAGFYDYRLVLLSVFIAVLAAYAALGWYQRRATAASRLEEALRESATLYRTLLNSMDEGFCIIQLIFDQAGKPVDYRFLEISASFAKQTGMQDAVGKRMREIAPDHEEYWFELLGKVALTGEPAHYLNEAKALAGYFDVRAFRVGKPELRQVAVVFSEISKRKQMDEARTRLAAIVESSEDAIIGKDAQGIINSWNSGAQKIFGYTSAEMVGQSIKVLLPDGHEHEEDEILNRIKQGETVDHFETMRRRKDGRSFNVSLTISPIKDASGKVVGASKIARDITGTKQLERQLQHSQKMDALGQLTGGIAHDFNNLLGIVLGNLDLLEGFTAGNPAALDQLQTAQRAAVRGADLTRRLLSFARMETLKPSSASLNASIQNMISMATRALGPEIEVITQFDDSLPRIFIDTTGLESALLNLVVNSRDAMPKGGSITISTRLLNLEATYAPVQLSELKAGWYACVSIADTGEGISKDTLDRVFEPFFTTKPRGKGTGLGLAMVYGFVKQSGGTVRIYSELGLGTTVTMYLPLIESHSKQTAAVVEVHSPAKLHSTVLVVDDEPDLLKIAVAYLAEMGCTALKAIDAAAALEIVKQEKNIDLMMTDIIMPGGINGVELAQRVHELNPHIKIIYTSGFAAEALAERKMLLVEGPLLRKPYQRTEFRATIRSVLEGNNTKPN